MNIDQIMDQLPSLIITYGTQLVMAIVIFLIGKWVAKAVSNAVVKGMNKKDVDRTVSSFVGNLIYCGLFAFVIIAALGQLGIQTASFVAKPAYTNLSLGDLATHPQIKLTIVLRCNPLTL